VFMASKKLCIELGDKLIKVCETGGKNVGIPHVSRCFVMPMPEGMITDGQIQDPALLATTLKAALADHGMAHAKKAVFALQSGKIAAREVKLPPVRDNKLQQMVEANAPEYFPVDMAKYHITYTLLERIDKGENAGCRVLVLAAPKTILEGYFRLASAAGLTIEAIDYAGNSRAHVLSKLPHGKGEAVVMYVDVGCTTSEVTVISGGRQMFQRTLAAGGDELVLAQLSALERPEADYLAAIGEMSAGEARISPETAIDTLSRFVGNIVRISDYYNSNNWESVIDKLVLYGDCASLALLRDCVEDSVTIPVEVMSELPGVTSPSKTPIPFSGFAACAGCTMGPVDFIPREFIKSRKKKANPEAIYIRLGIIVCTGLILIGASLSAVAVFEYMLAVGERKDMQEEIESLAAAERQYAAYLDYTAARDGFQAVYSEREKPCANLVEFIGELERKMPADIAVMSVVCTNESVSMNVTVSSKESAAAVLVKLRTFESLALIDLSGISETTSDNGIPQVAFSLVCTYGPNPWLASADEATLAAMRYDALAELEAEQAEQAENEAPEGETETEGEAQ
ncbi:MAG TPA: pilus assembly protein PilM, partial [Candidatus Acidoferrum sp.]|nr:pilus assembly protein PilM [Candidatus Acidoferrum sp.]